MAFSKPKLCHHDIPAERKALTFIDQRIRTREDLKDYITRKLGAPLHTVELTDEQLEDAIDDATLMWTKWATLPEKFIVKDLREYQNEDKENGIEEGIDLSEYRVANVTDIGGNDAFGMYGADGIWGLSNCMLATGTYPFIGRSFGGTNYDGFTTYQAAYEFVQMAKRLTAQAFDYRFNPNTQILQLIPNPNFSNKFRDTSIIFRAECVPPDDVLYGTEFIKELAIAYSKITLGIIRSKFQNVTFAGGVTVNANIGEEGKAELAALIERIKSEEAVSSGFYLG